MHRMLRSALLFALLLVPLGQAATATVSAAATIAGSGTSYRVTIRNTGDEPLRCVGLLLDGVQPTAATGPAGVLTRVGTFQGRGLVHMLAQQSDVVAPGGSVTVPFTTNAPIATNAGGELRYSSTCAAGSDVIGRATGPAPPPRPCTCKKLDVALFGTTKGSESRQTGFFARLELRWTMTCSGGPGKCAGRLFVSGSRTSRVLGVKVFLGTSQDGGRVSCTGTCTRTASGDERMLVDSDNRAFSKENIGKGKGRSITIEVDVFCSGERAPRIFELVFRPGTGNLDRRLSDLNGNGIPDGGARR